MTVYGRKKIMNKIKLIPIFIFLHSISNAQIAKTNIVEHFTNTNCSICASSNPNTFATLASHPDVLHIAFHPSSPYSSCFFSMQNPIENDARTNYYGIFGGTPRLMVNGILTNTSNLNSTLNSLASATSSFEIKTMQEFISSDSVQVKIIVKRISVDSNIQARLFVGAAEDTVFQTTGNGESIHHNVFRKTMSDITGDFIPSLPSMVNDSVILTYGYKILPNWNAARMNTVVILEKTDKEIINSSRSTNMNSIPTSIKNISKNEFIIYPNPSTNFFNLKNWIEFKQMVIYNSVGAICLNIEIISERTDITGLSKGFYLIELVDKKNQKVRHALVKQ